MPPQIKKILYATDLSKNSSYAFLYAIDMAKKHDARIVILHVIEPLPAYAEVYVNRTEEFNKKQHEEMIESMKMNCKDFVKKQRLRSAPRALNSYPKSSFLWAIRQKKS